MGPDGAGTQLGIVLAKGEAWNVMEDNVRRMCVYIRAFIVTTGSFCSAAEMDRTCKSAVTGKVK